VPGFRAAGFGIKDGAGWAFDVIREAGHEYDSSVFPAHRGHGGVPNAPRGPHVIQTSAGPLTEIPVSAIELLGRRFSMFGGGYLRLTPLSILRWGIGRLHDAGLPLIVYIHPREIDPDHPRLPLGARRNFKCYVNLHTTMPKLKWLLKNYSFCTMGELVERIDVSARADEAAVPARASGPAGRR